MRKGTSGLGQMLAFLAAAAEHEGIAALEAQHALAGLGEFDQAEGNIVLDGRRLAAALAGIFEFGAGPDPAQDVRVDQGIVDHDVAGLHGVVAEQRHEAGRAGAGAHQPDPARFEDGKGFGIEAGKSGALRI